METWKTVIGILAYASLGFALTSAYLQLNKIWKRKHHEEVANSISITGLAMTMIPGTIFALNFLVVAQWQGFINSLIWITWGLIMIMIGSGLWIQGHRRQGLWSNIKGALKLEKSEIGSLAMALFRPASADLVLRILTRFAWIDNKLDEREKDYIQGFADSWSLEIDWSSHQSSANSESLHANLAEIHRLVTMYLQTSPPGNQVYELADVLKNLVEIDEEVSEAEEVILTEVVAMLKGYNSDDGISENFLVVIAPRNKEQTEALKALLPESDEVKVAGGWGYKVGKYSSEKYANKMCERYRELGFFTVSMVLDIDVAT